MARIRVISVDSTLYERLLKVESELKRLTAERDALRSELLPTVQRLGRVEVAGARFESVTRVDYRFTERVAELSGMLKARKEFEIATKLAVPDKRVSYIKITEGESK